MREMLCLTGMHARGLLATTLLAVVVVGCGDDGGSSTGISNGGAGTGGHGTTGGSGASAGHTSTGGDGVGGMGSEGPVGPCRLTREHENEDGSNVFVEVSDVSYALDALGRPETVTVSTTLTYEGQPPNTTEQSYDFTYSNEGPCARPPPNVYSGFGTSLPAPLMMFFDIRACPDVDPRAGWTLSYDAAGHLTLAEFAGPFAGTLSVDYDADGRPTQVHQAVPAGYNNDVLTFTHVAGGIEGTMVRDHKKQGTGDISYRLEGTYSIDYDAGGLRTTATATSKIVMSNDQPADEPASISSFTYEYECD